MKIKIKKLRPDATLPTRSHPGDAGLDLYSLDDYDLEPASQNKFFFGFAIEIPLGYTAFLKDRSGLCLKSVHNLGGVIDAGFRGELSCVLINLGKETVQIKKGDRITQLVILPIPEVELEVTAELSDSSRRDGSFGSTNK